MIREQEQPIKASGESLDSIISTFKGKLDASMLNKESKDNINELIFGLQAVDNGWPENMKDKKKIFVTAGEYILTNLMRIISDEPIVGDGWSVAEDSVEKENQGIITRSFFVDLMCKKHVTYETIVKQLDEISSKGGTGDRDNLRAHFSIPSNESTRLTVEADVQVLSFLDNQKITHQRITSMVKSMGGGDDGLNKLKKGLKEIITAKKDVSSTQKKKATAVLNFIYQNYKNPISVDFSSSVEVDEIDLASLRTDKTVWDKIIQSVATTTRDNIGPFERFLSLFLQSPVFPQSGSAGAGDIEVGGKLVEVKYVSNGGLEALPKYSRDGLIIILMSPDGKQCKAIDLDKVYYAIFKNNDMEALQSAFAKKSSWNITPAFWNYVVGKISNKPKPKEPAEELSEHTKLTLTIGQLKKLIAEASVK